MLSSRLQDPDAAIRSTDLDAAGSRLSAVNKQYLKDPFIAHFVPRARLQPPRPPLINVGTYLRGTAIDELVDRWITIASREGQKFQIISLGAGSDTRFWRIATGPRNDSLANYVEMDFSEVTMKKAMAIRKSKELSAVLGGPENIKLEQGGMALHAPRYHLLPTDLRTSPTDSMGPLLASSNVMSTALPTLLLFECVLVYMSPTASSALLDWFVQQFKESSAELGSIVYEMFGLQDPFGQVMYNNMKARNVTLPGAAPYHDFASLPSRFLDRSYALSKALTLRDIRRDYVPLTESERISQLEMLDEIEELELVLSHYAITWGSYLAGVHEDPRLALWRDWGLESNPIQVEESDD